MLEAQEFVPRRLRRGVQWQHLLFRVHAEHFPNPAGAGAGLARVRRYCQLILLSTEALTAPLWMSVQATGKIRSYQILMACLIFLNFPIAYVALAIGLPVYSVWCVRILVNIFVIGARCIYMKKKLDFPLFLYFKKVMLPILNVTLLALPIPILLYYTIHGFWQNLIIVGIVTFIVTILDIYYIGMNIQEKEMVSNMILKKISLFRKES